MLPYWLLFAYFAVGSFAQSDPAGIGKTKPTMALGALIIVVMIGFRFQVGGDWYAYEAMLSYVRVVSLEKAMAIGDPGYQAINWCVAALGFDIWLVNLICAAVFVWGLVRLANMQPSPFLTILIAIPYLVIVVAMGYSRQAVAIGFVMAGLAALDKNGSIVRFAIYVALAALFHKTAVVALPLVIFAGRHNKFVNVLAGIALSFALYDVFLSDSVDSFVKNYVDQEYNSQGAAIRVGMSLIPAAVCLMFGKRLAFTPTQLTVWRGFSLAAFGLLIALLISPSSTAVDRIALYIIPLQLVVLSRVFLLFKHHSQGRTVAILYAAAIQFTWLNFAAHARFWVPYEFYPIIA
jgi:hypothetical protein